MAREEMLAQIRAALGRPEGEAFKQPPPVRFSKGADGDRVQMFAAALTALGGRVIEVEDEQRAQDCVRELVGGRAFVSSKDEFSRERCAAAGFGITSADYALAETGTLVFLTESRESRLISLLPPRHIAVIERAKILASLDELLSVLPRPAERSSAMTLVTGPSRTADIEMRLVRGVHGPGEITVIVKRV
jgi:L-lactate dehydrogenase complex protein LldG